MIARIYFNITIYLFSSCNNIKLTNRICKYFKYNKKKFAFETKAFKKKNNIIILFKIKLI